MDEYNYQVLSTLSILALGLIFGFFIGMLYYYQEIKKLKEIVEESIKNDK